MTEFRAAGRAPRDTDEVSSSTKDRSRRQIDPGLRRGLSGIVLAAAVLLAGPGLVATLTGPPGDPEDVPVSSTPVPEQPPQVSDPVPSVSPRGPLDVVENPEATRRALARITSSVIPVMNGHTRRVPNVSR